MKKTATAPRISTTAAEFYPGIFKTLNAGLEFVLDAFPVMYQRAMDRLKGPFTADELRILVQVFDNPTFSPALAGHHLLRTVQDGIELDGLNKNHAVSTKTLISKLKSLSTFEAACLELWAAGYWQARTHHPYRPDLDDYISGMLDDGD